MKTLGLALVGAPTIVCRLGWGGQHTARWHHEAHVPLICDAYLLSVAMRCHQCTLPCIPASVLLQVVIFGSAMDIAAIQQDTPQARETSSWRAVALALLFCLAIQKEAVDESFAARSGKCTSGCPSPFRPLPLIHPKSRRLTSTESLPRWRCQTWPRAWRAAATPAPTSSREGPTAVLLPLHVLKYLNLMMCGLLRLLHLLVSALLPLHSRCMFSSAGTWSVAALRTLRLHLLMSACCSCLFIMEVPAAWSKHQACHARRRA